MSRDDDVRAAAEAAHVAYERRAAEVGWETQPRSRVPWADVPEANKQAMYAAMGAAAPHLIADLVRERDEALAEVKRLRAWSLTLVSEVNAARSRAETAEAAIGRVEALCDGKADGWYLTVSAVRATLRGDA